MKLDDNSKVFLAKRGLAVTTAFGSTSALTLVALKISVLAFPALKVVGGSLLGAAAGFGWPITATFILVALIAFVAYKTLSETEEGDPDLAALNKTAKQRDEKEAQKEDLVIKRALKTPESEPGDVSRTENLIDVVNDFKDIGPAAQFRKLLEADEDMKFTPEQIDEIFKTINKSENLQMQLKNEEHAALLWIVKTQF